MPYKRDYRRVFAIIKQINQAGAPITHKDMVMSFTESRTSSLNDLSDGEFREFEDKLIRQAKTAHPSTYKSDPLDAARKAIIAQFKSIGRTTEAAIAWAEKYGVNGQKKRFNDYTGQELFVLVKNAEKVKHDFIRSAAKKL